jgi:hypothetical protein
VKFRYLVFCVFYTILLLSTFACGVTVETKTPYLHVTDYSFYTNDVLLAQKYIPFNIVVPTYIPKELGPKYTFEISGPTDNNSVDIQLDIDYANDNYVIYISEFNHEYQWGLDAAANPKVFDIEGIQVKREDATSFSPSGGVKGYNYYWNKNGISFLVGIFSFSETISEKFVRSMIQNQ